MGARAIGVDSDQHDEMPGVVMTSMIKRADIAVFDLVRDVTEGRFAPGMKVFGLRERGVDYVRDGAHAAGLSPATIERVAVLEAEVVAGRTHIPSH